MVNREKVGVIVTMLCEAFGRKATGSMLEAYCIGLNGLSDEQLDIAGTAALGGSGSFMPTPGQLRQLALCGGTTYEGRAEIAWREFDRAVGGYGGDYSVTFADGLINATLRLCGGWISNAEKCGDAYFVWLQKQFKETYIRLCQSGTSEEMRRGFSGRLEYENAGYTTEQLAKYNAYTGARLTIETAQPVIAGPTDEPPRLDHWPTGVPQLILRKAT